MFGNKTRENQQYTVCSFQAGKEIISQCLADLDSSYLIICILFTEKMEKWDAFPNKCLSRGQFCSPQKNIILVALNIKPLGVKYSGSSLGLLSRAPNEASLITVYRGCNHHKVPRDCQAVEAPAHDLRSKIINPIEDMDIANNHAIFL